MVRAIALLIAAALWLPSSALRAQQPDADATQTDAQAEIESLIKQQNQLADDYNAILRKIKQNEELVALETAIAEAKAELAKAEAGNDALTAARAAEQDTRKAVQQAVKQKLKEHGAGSQLLEQLEDLQAKRAEHLWQIELATFQLEHPQSPVNRALAGDEELAAAKARLDAAGIEDRSDAKQAYDELRAQKLEDIVEAQRLLATIEDSTAAAQRTLESMVAVEERLTPIRKQIERVESKRIEDARAKVADALNSDDIVKLRQAVNDRITEYNTLIKRLVAENPVAVRLKEEYDQVRAKVKALRSPAP